MERPRFAQLVWLVLLSLLVSACAVVQPQMGANVSVLKPSQFEANSGCKRISLLYFDTRHGVQPKTFARRIRSSLSKELRHQLRDVQYFKTTEIQPKADGSEFHQLTVYIHEFDVTTSPKNPQSVPKNQMITRKGRASATLKILEGIGNECVTPGSEIEEIRQVPVYRYNELPSKSQMVQILSKRVVTDLLAYISPRKVLTLRPVRTSLAPGKPRDASKLINNRSCEAAEKVLTAHLRTEPDDVKALYNLGVAYECMARDVLHQNRRIFLLNKAKEQYSTVLAYKPNFTDAAQAYDEVSRTIRFYAAIKKKHEDASEHLQRQFTPAGNY